MKPRGRFGSKARISGRISESLSNKARLREIERWVIARAWVSVAALGRPAGGFCLPPFLLFREVRRAEQSIQICHSLSSNQGRSVRRRRGWAARHGETHLRRRARPFVPRLSGSVQPPC